MKKGLTEIVFILDRSGSMGGLESDTIGGFNSMLAKQKVVEGEALLTTALFDDRYELLHDRIDIRAVNPITEKEYFVRGSTALYDAMGKTIQKISAAQEHTDEDYRAEKVMFVIITDGLENASRRFTSATVKALVEQQKEKFGWEFIFLGANIDAVEVANQVGILADRSQNYVGDLDGVRLNFCAMSQAATSLREKGVVSSAWKEEIDKDYKKRGKRK